MCLSLYALVLRTLVIELQVKKQLNICKCLEKKMVRPVRSLKSTKSKACNFTNYRWSVSKLKFDL